MTFRSYLEDEDDKPYFQLNTLAFYYEDMERKQKLIEDLAKKIVGYDLKLTDNLEEVEKEVAAKLAEFDDKIETLPASVNELLETWVTDGSIDTIIDTTLIDQKTAVLTAQLAETDGLNLPEMIKKPTGFSFPIPLNIYKDAQGVISVKDFDIESYHPVKKGTGKAYYIAKDGNNTNDGLTRNTAFKTFGKAYSMPDMDILYVAGGDYYRQSNVANALPARNIKMIAYNGEKVRLQNIGNSEEGELTWTSYGNGVYTTSRGGTVGVYDSKVLDEYNSYAKYVKKSSIADVTATKGSWFIDGTTVYVHTLNDAQPLGDSDIKLVTPGGASMNNNAVNTYYFEGIRFDMSDQIRFANAGTLLFKKCDFSRMCGVNGLLVDNATMVISEECTAFGNYADGFNYANTDFLEINCKGYANGLDNTTNTNNGSTSHNLTKDGFGVRINGMYFENKGPNVADVQANGFKNKVWNIGCVAYKTKTLADGYKNDFQTTDEMWLDSCVAYGSLNSAIATTGKINIRNSQLKEAVSGVVANY